MIWSVAGMKSMEKSFADLEQKRKKRKTGRGRFPEWMEVLTPWEGLLE